MKGQFAPIKATFSQPFRVLIRDMLQRDPQYRPSSHELLYMRLPELMKNVISDNRSKRASGLSLKSDFEGSNDGVQKSGAQNRNPDSANARSLVFEFNLQTMRIEPVSFPFRVKIKQVHFSLLNEDRIIRSIVLPSSPTILNPPTHMRAIFANPKFQPANTNASPSPVVLNLSNVVT